MASRFPYGEEITDKKLGMIAEAERIVKELAQIEVVRVRYHKNIARIEVHPDERPKFFNIELLDRLGNEIKKLGFIYATLDLQGYRSGSMNESLDVNSL